MELYLQVILTILVLMFSIIAVRFSFNFKFDLNKYLADRRKIRIDQLKNICPHCKIEFVDKDKKHIKIESYFSSPAGTPNWICRRCHLVVESEEDVNRISQSYVNNLNNWLEKEKRFYKQMKKLGLA